MARGFALARPVPLIALHCASGRGIKAVSLPTSRSVASGSVPLVFMPKNCRVATFILVVLASSAIGGCGGGVATSSLGLPAAASLPNLPSLPDLPDLPALPGSSGYSKVSPTDAYAQVARGVTSCWFGAGGTLKKTHMFYADADPPSSGGKAEIALIERDRDPLAASQRGAKVYRIAFGAEGSGTRIEHVNHKLSEPLVAGIEADVHRFAAGDLTCATAGAMMPKLEPAPVAVVPVKIKGKRKPPARSG